MIYFISALPTLNKISNTHADTSVLPLQSKTLTGNGLHNSPHSKRNVPVSHSNNLRALENRATTLYPTITIKHGALYPLFIIKIVHNI